MSINKLALVRYKTIDNCLQNRYRRWTLEDLVEAVSDALYEYEGITKGVSVRTVQLDIQNMRSEKLGYNAPIVVVNRKYYTYEDKDYSITNIPLTQQDLGTLNEVVEVLKQFKGFGYFQELTGMVNRLEDKIFKAQHKGRSYISFEKNDLLRGLEFIDPLHKATMRQMVLRIQYQSFKVSKPTEITAHPYLLKEFRNRWFLICKNRYGQLMNLALDRMVSAEEAPDILFSPSPYDMDTYFDDTIGVSKSPGQVPQLVVMRVSRLHAPYIITKPMHPSQAILKEEKDSVLFSIKVIWNFELEKDILGLGEGIEVLSPRRLRNKIYNRALGMAANYSSGETI